MAQIIKEPLQDTAIVRLVRCTRTGRYFDGSGWTDDAAYATHYGNELEAMRACVENGLKDVELVLRAAGTDSDLFCTLIR